MKTSTFNKTFQAIILVFSLMVTLIFIAPFSIKGEVASNNQTLSVPTSLEGWVAGAEHHRWDYHYDMNNHTININDSVLNPNPFEWGDGYFGFDYTDAIDGLIWNNVFDNILLQITFNAADGFFDDLLVAYHPLIKSGNITQVGINGIGKVQYYDGQKTTYEDYLRHDSYYFEANNNHLVKYRHEVNDIDGVEAYNEYAEYKYDSQGRIISIEKREDEASSKFAVTYQGNTIIVSYEDGFVDRKWSAITSNNTIESLQFEEKYYQWDSIEKTKLSANYKSNQLLSITPASSYIGPYQEDNVIQYNGNHISGYADSVSTANAPRQESNSFSYTGYQDVETDSISNKVALYVSPSSLSLNVDETKKITAMYAPPLEDGKEIEWSSSDENVVVVSRDGTVKGVGVGTATVSATYPNTSISASCQIAIKEEIPNTPSANVFANQKDGWPLANNNAAFGYANNYRISPVKYFQVYGVDLSSLFDSGVKYLPRWNGNCFGLAILSISQFNKQIDLKQFFSHGGNSLYEFGYESIKQTDGKQFYSLEVNSEAIDIVEKALISQDSVELKEAKVFSGDSDYSELLNYLSKDDAKPLLATFKADMSGHAVVIATDSKPIKVTDSPDWYAIPIYDSNAPYNDGNLVNPTDAYKRERSWLFVNTKTSEWRYQMDGKNRMSSKYYDVMELGRTIWFYNLEKLPSDYYSKRLDCFHKHIQIQFWGSDYEVKDENDNIRFKVTDGKVVSLDDRDEYNVRFGYTEDESALPLYTFYTDEQQLNISAKSDMEILGVAPDCAFEVEQAKDSEAALDFQEKEICCKSGKGASDVVAQNLDTNGTIAAAGQELGIVVRESNAAIYCEKIEKYQTDGIEKEEVSIFHESPEKLMDWEGVNKSNSSPTLNGIIQRSDGKWAMYKNGKLDTSYNGIAQNQYGWWKVTNGYVTFKETGIFKNEYGWWRVEDSKVNFKANGIYKNQYGWWKTTDGKVTFRETGVFKNDFGWWRVKDSKVDFNAQSIYQNKFGWWKTTNGKVTFKENGLFKNQYGTWKVENSKVNFNYNGTYQGKVIKNGKVQ